MRPATQSVNFIYIGDKLPNYVNASLDLATEFSGLNINFIGNAKVVEKLRSKSLNVNKICIEDFYESNKFDLAKKNIKFSHSFRDGFWLKTLERFFVLEQFMKFGDFQSIFHAELDQLLFRCDHLITKIDLTDLKGIFLPFHDSTRAVASIFYCNDYESIESLTDFSVNTVDFANEMELIASWAKTHKDMVHALPTLASETHKQFYNSNLDVNILSIEDTDGVSDAAQVGQWIAGIEPKNVPLGILPRTKFSDSPSPFLLSKNDFNQIKFDFDFVDGFLIANFNALNNVKIYNLHIHSKIHSWFAKSNNLKKGILFLANREEPYVVFNALKQQLSYNLITILNQMFIRIKKIF